MLLQNEKNLNRKVCLPSCVLFLYKLLFCSSGTVLIVREFFGKLEDS